MTASTLYIVRFIRNDKMPDEIYRYNNKQSAMDHFRLFYESDSAELYDQIQVVEFDHTSQASSLIGLLSFIEKNADGVLIKKDWRNWSIGRLTIWEYHDFDGYGQHVGFISEIYDDHAIMEADGMKLWIDDTSVYMFR